MFGLAYVKWLQPFAIDDRLELVAQHYAGISGRGLAVDEFQYLSIAKNLASGAGYSLAPGEPTAIRVPGYPLYIAVLFRVFGSSVQVALLGNAFLVALLPALTFAISKPAFGCKTASAAAFFCALNPGLYYFVLGEAMSEALFAVLLCSGIAMWQRAQPLYSQDCTADLTAAETGTRRLFDVAETRVTFLFASAAGILFGAANLTRPGFLGLPLFILLVEFVARRPNQFFLKAFVFCLWFVLTLSPWAIRNRVVIGTVLFSSTNDGRTLLGSMLAAKLHRGDWQNPEFVGTEEYERVGRMAKGIERNRAETRLAIAELKRISPVTLVEVVVKRVLRLWVPLNRIVSDNASIKANIAVNLFYFPGMLLAALGLWRARHNPAIVPLWTTFLYVTLLAAISWGGTRFRYPLEPFLAVFAAHGLFEMYKLFPAHVSAH